MADKANDLNPLDSVSRERWSMTLAAIMSATLTIPQINIIVAGGKEEFRRVSRTHLQGHAFRQEDLDRVFTILERTAKLNRKPDISKLLAQG